MKLITESTLMRRLVDAVKRLAERDVTVLIRGETGTGKELIASLLHAHGKRAHRPFVRFNCAALPGELAESELFGHLKGAFTGAQATRPGFFSEADGGTLVLDEVGELPTGVQAKLLRAVQDGEIQPVGSTRPEKVDVRIVASTNRDLRAEVSAGRFREDLYYRLAVVELVVPPLRNRRDDIPALAEEFARCYAERFDLEELRLSEEFLARLVQFDWPGNVRQLENAIARLAALSTGGVIDAAALDPIIGQPAPPAEDSADGLSLREQLESLERSLIERALVLANGNRSAAARRLGTSRVTLIDKLKKYGITQSRPETVAQARLA
ncbi:MAG TPA: sigma-54 dependent transcriptional regulator [Burkholderiales bacterium]|nr:sigma-54 dependent transcriptional regulator [Burkholderiales bacterium]